MNQAPEKESDRTGGDIDSSQTLLDSTRQNNASGRSDNKPVELKGEGQEVPRIVDIVPSWGTRSRQGKSNAGIDDRFCTSGSIVNEGVLRTRTAPAGPHPYLDRFASGMHRPLEGKRQYPSTTVQRITVVQYFNRRDARCAHLLTQYVYLLDKWRPG